MGAHLSSKLLNEKPFPVHHTCRTNHHTKTKQTNKKRGKKHSPEEKQTKHNKENKKNEENEENRRQEGKEPTSHTEEGRGATPKLHMKGKGAENEEPTEDPQSEARHSSNTTKNSRQRGKQGTTTGREQVKDKSKGGRVKN